MFRPHWLLANSYDIAKLEVQVSYAGTCIRFSLFPLICLLVFSKGGIFLHNFLRWITQFRPIYSVSLCILQLLFHFGRVILFVRGAGKCIALSSRPSADSLIRTPEDFVHTQIVCDDYRPVFSSWGKKMRWYVSIFESIIRRNQVRF